MIQAIICRDPDIAFLVLINIADEIGTQTVGCVFILLPMSRDTLFQIKDKNPLIIGANPHSTLIIFV